MDISPIINQIYSTLWYLIPLAILAGILKSPWFKGVIGEFQVNLLLKFFLSKKDYHLIKDVTLPTENGTTQIDHILVSKFGIFVIETKNMKGWIFGNAKQKQWTQKIFKHSEKFQNPIHQNYKHLKTIENNLKIDKESLFSVIVFIGNSTFKTDMPENVTYAGGCIRFIKSKKSVLFTESQVHEIISSLEHGRLERSYKTNREHVAHVNEIVKEKADKNNCPNCGSEMVLRESKKGKNAGNKFWGCSSFPKCRTIINIT